VTPATEVVEDHYVASLALVGEPGQTLATDGWMVVGCGGLEKPANVGRIWEESPIKKSKFI